MHVTLTMQDFRYREDGFTVPELIVVMVLTLLFSSMVLSFAFDFWGGATQLQNSSDTFVDRQNVGDKIRDSINEASSLINQNSIADANTALPDASDASNTRWLLLHAIPVTTAMPTKGQSQPVFYFEAPAKDQLNHYIMRGVTPFQNEYVIYMDGSKKTTIDAYLGKSGC